MSSSGIHAFMHIITKHSLKSVPERMVLIFCMLLPTHTRVNTLNTFTFLIFRVFLKEIRRCKRLNVPLTGERFFFTLNFHFNLTVTQNRILGTTWRLLLENIVYISRKAKQVQSFPSQENLLIYAATIEAEHTSSCVKR